MIFTSSLAWAATSYYVDDVGGDDSRSGKAPEEAWRSLEKVNGVDLQPGDQVLFRAGGSWEGQLAPFGSGSKEAPVLIGRYGEGESPRIEGQGKVLDAVLVRNFSFIEVRDLEVTNQGEQRVAWRTGVKIEADGFGKMEGVIVRNLYVHDVNGDLRKEHEGCGIYFEAKGRRGTHFDGLLIEGCRVERTDRNGVCQRGHGRMRSENVVIRGNHLEDIGGDGIKLWGTNGGLIEYNVVRKARARCEDHAAGIWPFDCDDTLIQFNEVSGTVGIKDGQAFDSDYLCRRTVIQYNYSFENEGGFILLCAPGWAHNEGTIVRYNVSVHDGINSARVFHFGGGSKRNHIYNNTVIVGAHQELPMMLFTEWDGGHAQDTKIENNLFVVEEGGRAFYRFDQSRGNVFESNLFCGRHEGLPDGVETSAMPEFAGPLVPKPGIESVKAFRPVGANVARGNVIAENGGRDLLGGVIADGSAPAIGALEP